jgi:hypothetical protein
MHVGGGYFDYVLPKSLFNNNSFLQTNQKTCQFFAHLFVSSFFGSSMDILSVLFCGKGLRPYII